MLDPYAKYRNWVKDSIKIDKIKQEMLYAINWMEANSNIYDHEIILQNQHPGCAFSKVILTCLDNAQNKIIPFQPIVDWLADNQKCPFGLILKVKSYKIIRRSIPLLNEKMINQLYELQTRSYKMKYRPREFLYLDKLLDDTGLTSRYTGAGNE